MMAKTRRIPNRSVRRCKGCSTPINHKHVNAKFCCQRCKDRYHNTTNPRGYYQPTVNGVAAPKGYAGITDQEHEAIMNDMEQGWDAHKDAF